MAARLRHTTGTATRLDCGRREGKRGLTAYGQTLAIAHQFGVGETCRRERRQMLGGECRTKRVYSWGLPNEYAIFVRFLALAE